MKVVFIALITLCLTYGAAFAGCSDARYTCSAYGYKDSAPDRYEFVVPCCYSFPLCHTCDNEEVLFAKYCMHKEVTIKVMHKYDPFKTKTMTVPAQGVLSVDDGCFL